MRGDDVVNYSQSQTGSHLVCSKKRRKYLIQIFFFDTLPVVGEGHFNKRFLGLNKNFETAIFIHGLKSVHRYVQKGLIKLISVSED